MQTKVVEALPVGWQPRREPLEAVAVAASGATARLLARRVLALDDEALSLLRGLVGEDCLVLLGDAHQLPWVPGVLYLGRDPEASQLLVPTVTTPTVPVALLQRGLLARFPLLHPPLAVLAFEQRVISAFPSRTIDRERLRAWAEVAA